MRVLGEGVNGGGDLCARPVKPFERGRPWLRWTRAPCKFNRENDYDWLGSGVYFWESNPARALDWAQHLQESRRGSPRSIVESYVVGAVLELGYCLDLISTAGIESVKASYLDLRSDAEKSDVKMPVNQGGSDLLQRRLDCAVINYMHAVNKRDKRRAFETVRGVFLEGKPIYETSGFYEKTHIQICVRNLPNIKGVFRVPDSLVRTRVAILGYSFTESEKQLFVEGESWPQLKTGVRRSCSA